MSSCFACFRVASMPICIVWITQLFSYFSPVPPFSIMYMCDCCKVILWIISIRQGLHVVTEVCSNICFLQWRPATCTWTSCQPVLTAVLLITSTNVFFFFNPRKARVSVVETFLSVQAGKRRKLSKVFVKTCYLRQGFYIMRKQFKRKYESNSNFWERSFYTFTSSCEHLNNSRPGDLEVVQILFY